MLVITSRSALSACCWRSSGIILVGPFVAGITAFLTAVATWITTRSILPLISIFVEPAKVLFLNNAINHGIMGPIGIQQAAETGKSIMFLIETNPGPGMGIILAYGCSARARPRARRPVRRSFTPRRHSRNLLPICADESGASARRNRRRRCRRADQRQHRRGPCCDPSPGSIFALLAMAPKGDTFWVLLSVLTSCAVSFAIGSIFVRRSAKRQPDDGSLAYAQQQVQSMKAESKGKLKPLDVKIVFACDAGMGSSAMGATTLRKQINKAGFRHKGAA